MTSTTGTDEHPEVAEISALAEGVLPADRSTEVRSHLGSCPLCGDVLVSLKEIRNVLGTLPGPPRMPAGISGRIDAALAAEALLASAAKSSSSEAAVSRETAAGSVKTTFSTSVSRETAASTDPRNRWPP